MASLLEIEQAAADMLVALFPARAPARGWFGESPAPSGPYFYYRTQVTDGPDLLIRTLDDQGLVQTISAPASTISLEVSFNGAAAYADALKLFEALWFSQRAFDLFAVCGLQSIERPRDLSALNLGATQTRADLTVYLSASVTLTGPAETIGSVDVRLRENQTQFDRTVTIQEGTPP